MKRTLLILSISLFLIACGNKGKEFCQEAEMPIRDAAREMLTLGEDTASIARLEAIYAKVEGFMPSQADVDATEGQSRAALISGQRAIRTMKNLLSAYREAIEDPAKKEDAIMKIQFQRGTLRRSAKGVATMCKALY